MKRVLLLASLSFASPALASPSMIDSFSGRWTNFDLYVTMGACGVGSSPDLLTVCSPSQLAEDESIHMQASGLAVATNSILSVADKVRHQQISGNAINDIFQSYNYSDATLVASVGLTIPHWSFGVYPVRRSIQLSIENPSLPFASISNRSELGGYVATGWSFSPLRDWHLSLGLNIDLIYYNDKMAEATIVDLVGKSPSEIFTNRKGAGFYASPDLAVTWGEQIHLRMEALDLGTQEALEQRYLYVTPQRLPRLINGFYWTPPLVVGKLVIGAQLMSFLTERNTFQDQWFTTLSLYMGPLRILSSLRPNFLRTGLALSYKGFAASMAQEWIHRIGRQGSTQPRFIFGFSAGL